MTPAVEQALYSLRAIAVESEGDRAKLLQAIASTLESAVAAAPAGEPAGQITGDGTGEALPPIIEAEGLNPPMRTCESKPLRAANLSAALRAIVRECRGPERSYSDDSYLPPHLLDLAVAALESTETQEFRCKSAPPLPSAKHFPDSSPLFDRIEAALQRHLDRHAERRIFDVEDSDIVLADFRAWRAIEVQRLGRVAKLASEAPDETPLQVIEAMRHADIERAPSYEELRERREKRP